MTNIFSVLGDIPTERVAERLGLEVVCGRINCLWHDDTRPSCIVRDGYHCFACGARGDNIDLVRRALRCDVKPAAAWLGKEFGVTIDYTLSSTDIAEYRAAQSDKRMYAQWRRELISGLADDYRANDILAAVWEREYEAGCECDIDYGKCKRIMAEIDYIWDQVMDDDEAKRLWADGRYGAASYQTAHNAPNSAFRGIGR